MTLPPEFDDERPGEGMRGVVLAIVGSLIFYAVIAAFIFAITGCVSRLYERVVLILWWLFTYPSSPPPSHP